ncbi:unnamed protein product [Paramecium sonneborni]|uniref:Wntless-like transmembrane domain-containing protein n=1 Tax=Paramecium sonneborni TaxID=65129 RepID=A0A8S1MVT5_9CILI|nr:unnamed protein product [Paramecium sonneborni]
MQKEETPQSDQQLNNQLNKQSLNINKQTQDQEKNLPAGLKISETSDQKNINQQSFKTARKKVKNQINADLKGKTACKRFWILTFIVIIAFVIGSFFLPNSIISVEQTNICQLNFLNNNEETQKICLSEQNSVIALFIQGLQQQNQFMVAYAKFNMLTIPKLELRDINFTTSLFAVNNIKEDALFQNNLTSIHNSLGAYCYKNNSKQLNTIPQQNTQKNEDIIECSSLKLFNLFHLNYENYLIVINFTQLEQPQKNFIENFNYEIDFEFKVLNPIYQETIFIIRLIFLLTSIIAFLIFIFKMRNTSYQKLCLEQKFIIVLSFLLILYNDPLYILTIQNPNKVSLVFDVIFMSSFVIFIIFYWLESIENINDFNGKKFKYIFFIPKMIFSIIIWIFFSLCYILLAFNYFDDPLKNFNDYGEINYFGMKWASCGLIILYIIKQIKQFALFIFQYETRQWRFKQSGLLMINYFLIVMILVFTGSFSIINYAGEQVLISIALLNIYVYSEQYHWVSVEEREEKIQNIKDDEKVKEQQVNYLYSEENKEINTKHE